MMRRARNPLVRRRTVAINALRAHMPEFGVIAPQGVANLERLIKTIEENTARLPELARSILRLIAAQLNSAQAKVRLIEAQPAKWRRHSEVSRRLATVPGVGIGRDGDRRYGLRSEPIAVLAARGVP
jgi:transposase